jgi:RNA polymerase sigma factor (sigma-70 family)
LRQLHSLARLRAADRDNLVRALDRLPPEQRAVLRFRFIDGRGLADTAGVLGTTESEVKRLQARALVALRRELENEPPR